MLPQMSAKATNFIFSSLSSDVQLNDSSTCSVTGSDIGVCLFTGCAVGRCPGVWYVLLASVSLAMDANNNQRPFTMDCVMTLLWNN